MPKHSVHVTPNYRGTKQRVTNWLGNHPPLEVNICCLLLSCCCTRGEFAYVRVWLAAPNHYLKLSNQGVLGCDGALQALHGGCHVSSLLLHCALLGSRQTRHLLKSAAPRPHLCLQTNTTPMTLGMEGQGKESSSCHVTTSGLS